MGHVANVTHDSFTPTAERSNIQIVLDLIQAEEPLYQTNFDSIIPLDSNQNVKVEGGRLVASSETGFTGANLSNLSSERFAVEYEVQILESAASSSACYLSVDNEIYGEAHRNLNFAYRPFGNLSVEHYQHPDQWPNLYRTYAVFDPAVANKVTVIILGDQIAAFIDGELAFTILDPDGSTAYVSQNLGAENQVSCQFDDYKLWDLSGVDFQP